MIFKKLNLLFFLLLLSVGCDEGGAEDPDADSDTGDKVLETPLVKGLGITQIAIYQSVKITLMKDGVAVQGELAPVIAEKDAMLRIFVERKQEWTDRSIFAEIELESAVTGKKVVSKLFTVTKDSTNEDLESTLNLEIPAEYINVSSTYVVSLKEVDDNISAEGDGNDAFWPPEQPMSLFAKKSWPLHLVIVPVEYQWDSSGRLPNFTEDFKTTIKEVMLSRYPITDVELEIAPAFFWDQKVDRLGDGWGPLLSAITTLKEDDNSDGSEFYYALVNPADTYKEYCGERCMVGLSHMVENLSGALQVGVGIGFNDREETMKAITHELGHGHGRFHAPCGVNEGLDPNYPHEGAFIGVQGYDIFENSLKDANETFDFMSYCQPPWVSDYTLNGLWERATEIAASAKIDGLDENRKPWVSIGVGVVGEVFRGPDLNIDLPPSSETVNVELLNADKKVIEIIKAHFNPWGHNSGGLTLFPAPADNVVYARLPGREAVLL